MPTATKNDDFDLAQYGVTIDDIRGTARKLTTMFPSDETNRYRGPDVITFNDLKIRTKEQGLVTFRPRKIQQNYLDTLFGGRGWEQDPTGLRGVRDIILKGRQFGMSTLLMALYFIETIQTPYTNTVIIAHDAPTTERMFQTVHRFYHHLPADKKPSTQYENKRELYWPELDSSFYVGQAGSVNFGAGMTINNVHCSELPRWPNAKLLMDSIMESVPAGGNITLESTALGVGNYFQQEWELAEEGEGAFTPRFFCWIDHEEYRINLKDYQERKIAPPKAALDYLREGPTKEEAEIKETFKLDDEQMMWMVSKRKSLREKFPQEYPFTPEEAFISTGQPYFDLPYLVNLNRVLRRSDFDPMEEPPIPRHYRKLIEAERTEIAEQKSLLMVWEPPRRDRLYVIGADPAEGINDEGDHDFCSVDVLDTFTRTQVAHFHGRWGTHEFGLMLAELGWWYNTALLCVERNNHGHAVLDALIHKAFYPFMDETREGGLYLHEEFDKKTNKLGNRPGWPTYRPQKNLALDFLAQDLEERNLNINCRGTVAQLMRFVKLPNGKAGGAEDSHDDRVTSLALAVAMLHLRPAHIGSYVVGGARQPEVLSGGMVLSGGVKREFFAPGGAIAGLRRNG